MELAAAETRERAALNAEKKLGSDVSSLRRQLVESADKLVAVHVCIYTRRANAHTYVAIDNC